MTHVPSGSNVILTDDVLTIILQFTLCRPNDWSNIAQVSKQFRRVRDLSNSSRYMPVPCVIKQLPFLCSSLMPNLQYHDIFNDLKHIKKLNIKTINPIKQNMKHISAKEVSHLIPHISPRPKYLQDILNGTADKLDNKQPQKAITWESMLMEM